MEGREKRCWYYYQIFLERYSHLEACLDEVGWLVAYHPFVALLLGLWWEFEAEDDWNDPVRVQGGHS